MTSHTFITFKYTRKEFQINNILKMYVHLHILQYVQSSFTYIVLVLKCTAYAQVALRWPEFTAIQDDTVQVF